MITPSFGLTATERVLPRLALDFTTGDLDPRITFTRADATATRINSSGNLEVVSADVARLDYSPSTLSRIGLLVEEARTNSIRNNTMQGATVSPFGPPTNWGIPAVSGLAASITSLGTENGIDYIDIRLNGTATGVQAIVFETTTGVTVVNGETWTTSFYCKLVGGDLTNVVYLKPRVTEHTSAGGFVVAATGDAFTPDGSNLILQRKVFTRTLAGGATVARLQPGIEYSVDGAVDFTIRVGLPQLEKGLLVTTPIKTSTAAVTRNADLASIIGANFSDFFNATEGTFVAQWLCPARTPSNSFPKILHVNDGAGGGNSGINITVNTANGSSFGGIYNDANVFQGVNKSWPNPAAGAVVRTVLAYGTTAQAAQNAVLGTEAVGISLPTGQNAMGIGQSYTGLQLNSHLQKILYYPQRLTNAEVQAFSK